MLCFVPSTLLCSHLEAQVPAPEPTLRAGWARGDLRDDGELKSQRWPLNYSDLLKRLKEVPHVFETKLCGSKGPTFFFFALGPQCTRSWQPGLWKKHLLKARPDRELWLLIISAFLVNKPGNKLFIDYILLFTNRSFYNRGSTEGS